MELLIATAIVLVILVVWSLMKTQPDDGSATAQPITPLPDAESRHVTISTIPRTEIDRLIDLIEEFKRLDSPEFSRVKELGGFLDRVYPSQITSVQKTRIETLLPDAMTGKRVSAELTVKDVQKRTTYFWTESSNSAGQWVQLMDHPPLLIAECETFDKDVVRLQRGQSVMMSGRIAKATILWPTIVLMIVDSAITPAGGETGTERVAQVLIDSPEQRHKEEPSDDAAHILPGSGTDFGIEPSYRTVPLTSYSIGLQQHAADLFEKVRRQLGNKCKRYKGSFSIFARSSGETAAKIVIYERGLGREFGDWPFLANGVYILVRCNSTAGESIWQKPSFRSNPYFARLDRARTLGIAPAYGETFAYFLFTSRRRHGCSCVIIDCLHNACCINALLLSVHCPNRWEGDFPRSPFLKTRIDPLPSGDRYSQSA